MAASVRQSKKGEATGSPGSLTVTFDAPCVAGNTVVVLVGQFGNSTLDITTSATVMDDDQSVNAYAFRGSDNRSTHVSSVGIWDRVNISGAVNSVTYTPPSGSNITYSVVLVELQGVTTTPFDKIATSTGGGSSTTPATASTGTLSQADEIAIGIEHHDTGSNLAITNPSSPSTWSLVQEAEDGSTSNTFNCSSLVVSSTSALTPQWTVASSVQWTAAVATYKAASAGNTAAWTEADDTCSASGWKVFAAWVKEVGFVTNTTAASTSAITVATGGVPVGDTIVIYGALDNSGTNGAVQTITVADNSSQSGTANTYTVQTPHAIADPGAAAAGQEGILAVCTVTRALLAADTITVTYSTSTTAKAINAQQFTYVKRGTPVLSGTYQHQDNNTGTSVSVSATATQAGQIVCAATFVEGGTADTFTQDNDTTNGSWVTLTRRGSGTTTSGSTLNSTYKLLTASGSQTYNPTLGTARDQCAAMLILDCIPRGAPAWTEDADTSAGTGQSGAAGTSSWTEAADTLAASGTVGGGASISGTAAWTEAADGSTASGKVGHTATSAWTEAADGSTASGTKGHKGTSSWTEAADGATASGTRTHKATAAWTEASDTLAALSSTVLYPASISGRKVRDQNGNVFLLRTFSSWGMAQQLSNADITTALTGVAANGFNAVTVDMTGSIDHGTGWTRYQNTATGQNFWTGTAFQSSLGAAWASVDWIVSEAYRLGMCVCMSLFGGTGDGGAPGGEGGKHDWLQASDTQMYNAGVAVATRYLSSTNIIWHLELDQADSPTNPPGVKAEAFFHGVNDTEGASTRPLRWMEPANGTTANAQGWVGTAQLKAVNSGYSYSGNSAVAVEGWYTDNTSVPVIDCEPPYDASPNYTTGEVGQQLRERTYAVFLEGGAGLQYGHERWWPFGGAGIFDTEGIEWPAVQAHSHTVQQSYAFRLVQQYVRDLNWVPANGTFVTTGQGTTDTKCAEGKTDTAALAYFPNSRTIAVDTTIITGTAPVRLRWYDPTNGTYTLISGSEAQQTGRSVTHPGNTSNSAGSSDWVLVLDLPTSATIAWTETSDTLVANGTPTRVGTSSTTEAVDTLSAAGKINRTGTSSTTEASDTLTAAGKVGHKATAAWTETQDTMTAAGVGHTQTGTGAWTEVGDTLTAAASSTHKGTASWTEANDALNGIGGAGTTKGGPASWTEASDGCSAAGKVGHRITLAWTEDADTWVGVGNAAHPAAAAWTEANDVLTAVGTRAHLGLAAWTEAADLFAGFESEHPPWGARPTTSAAGSVRKITSTGTIRTTTSQGANL